jgi:hypothetical protein
LFPLVVLVIALVVIVGSLIGNAVQIASFDNSFYAGTIKLDAPIIYLGASANPTFTEEMWKEVPTGSKEGILTTPRSFSVTDKCVSLKLPSGTLGVKVLTQLPNHTMVLVTMPPKDVGTVVICGPSGASIDVVIWAITN